MKRCSKRMREKGCRLSASEISCTGGYSTGKSYYREVREDSVETEDVLNAGHCVEPFKETQLCAVTAGAVTTSAVRRAAHLMLSSSLFPFGRSLLLVPDAGSMVGRSNG